VIKDLDIALKALLKGEAKPAWELATADISVAAPEATWRTTGTGLKLDVYLASIAENRDLRSNERLIDVDGGFGQVTPFPPRVDCTYLISAKNNGTPVAGKEQELQEHRLLSQALWVLLRNPSMPRKYLSGLLAAQELDPPLIAAQPANAEATAEFWSAFDTYPRPTIACRVTIGLELEQDFWAPLVTTAHLIVDGEERLVAGGTVLDASGAAIAGAWIQVVETSQVVVAGPDGRFEVDFTASGPYTLIVRAPGYREGGGPIVVPSPTGTYDVALVSA
jgi:hypothetical protein